MDSTTTTTQSNESKIFGITTRAIIVLSLAWTVCGVEMVKVFIWAWTIVQTSMFEPYSVSEPIYSLAVAALSYYFGKSQSGKQTTTTEGNT